jgi:RNase P subunit RPR2
MTAEQFVNKLGNYFVKTHKNVLMAILDYIADGPQERLDDIYSQLQETISPKTTIGISDIKAVCEQKGIPTKKRVLRKPREGIPVACDCCGYQYKYVQGALPDDYGQEKCPLCGFPYYETYLHNVYKGLGRIGAYPMYDKMVRAYKDTDQFIAEAKRKAKNRGEEFETAPKVYVEIV